MPITISLIVINLKVKMVLCRKNQSTSMFLEKCVSSCHNNRVMGFQLDLWKKSQQAKAFLAYLLKKHSNMPEKENTSLKLIWHQILFLAVLVYFMVNFDASGQSSLRKIINLDGVWSIVEGDTIQPPATYPDSIIVPGLVNLAKPAFLNPGSVPATRQAFWYKRYFNIIDTITEQYYTENRAGTLWDESLFKRKVCRGKIFGIHPIILQCRLSHSSGPMNFPLQSSLSRSLHYIQSRWG